MRAVPLSASPRPLSCRSSLQLLVVLAIMLLAVMPHLAAMTLPALHGPAVTAAGAGRAIDEAVPCHERDGNGIGSPSAQPCCNWGCSVISPAKSSPVDLPHLVGHRIAADDLPTPPGIAVKPGERPPRRPVFPIM